MPPSPPRSPGFPLFTAIPKPPWRRSFDIPDGYSFHGQIVHYPALVLIDPQGREAFRYVGQNNGDRYAFDDFAAKIAEREAIPKRERTPNGRHFSLARRPH